MKIINKKGKKEHVSTFFHSKETENEFRKYYILFTFLVGFFFFLTSLLIFTIVGDLIISLILIVVSGIVLYLLKDKYIVSIVDSVMQYTKSRHGEKSENTSKYSKKLEPSSNKKVNHKKSTPKSLTKIKEKLFKKKESEESYIEIK